MKRPETYKSFTCRLADNLDLVLNVRSTDDLTSLHEIVDSIRRVTLLVVATTYIHRNISTTFLDSDASTTPAFLPHGTPIQADKSGTVVFGVLVEKNPHTQIPLSGNVVWMGQQAALVHPVMRKLLNLCVDLFIGQMIESFEKALPFGEFPASNLLPLAIGFG